MKRISKKLNCLFNQTIWKWSERINRIICAPGEYILQPSTSNNVNELDNLSLEEALQLAGISDLNVSIEKETFVTCYPTFIY